MATGDPIPIPFPLSSFPGANTQESAGRLINCTAEPLGEAQNPSGPAPTVWRRQPGLSLHAVTAQTGYRGGLIVNNLSYEAFSGQALTVDPNGIVNVLGAFPGTKKISIARNLRTGVNSPDVVAVDLDNGAYSLNTGGVPALYTGGGVLPQPKAVCFQDGYLFFLIGDGRIFASGINALTQNALTFTTMQAKPSTVPMRVIPFSGLVWAFSSAGCERYQDVANVAPNFPYARLDILEWGLVQENAIAGFEDGFQVLTWVAQDFGVWQAQPFGGIPQKISPPDLDRLIEDQVRAGNLLEAGCYIYSGKKFFVLSSPAWTWEFNLATGKWSERWSLYPALGVWGRWRGTCGHPAFGKWLVGDQSSGNLLWVDRTNFSENGAPQLFRIESGPVVKFPNQIRIARADFYFDMGVGIAVGNTAMQVTGAAAGAGGAIQLTVVQVPPNVQTNDQVNVLGVTGTTEANGTWPCTVVNNTHLLLNGSVFVHAYVSGGVVTDVTSPPNVQNPVAAISCSKDGGQTWGVPLVRSLAPQGRTKRYRVSVKNQGLSSSQGDRWRLDVTDPVYTGFMQATQSSDPREVGA
jgi:hypothetical protein